MDYSKTKIHLSVDTKLLEKVDKIKKFPKWRGNRSAVIEAALEEFLEKNG